MNSTYENKTIYIVQDVLSENNDTKTILLKIKDGSLPQYVAGQFITIYLPESNTLEGKAYTFSSAPHESTCNITVKNIGEFSNYLCNLTKGDQITASLPYGYFSSEYPERDLVLYAGGIGITPFRSIILDTLKLNPDRRIFIHHSIKLIHDAVFQNEFKDISLQHPNISIQYYVTQELNISHPFKKGRISIKETIQSLDNKRDKEFLICGSISFVRDIWKELQECNVNENDIYTEAFFR